MIIRLLLLSLFITSFTWCEDVFQKWSTTKDSLIDVNWTDKDGVQMFFLVHSQGFLTLRTGDDEKRGKFNDDKKNKNNKKTEEMLGKFVAYIYGLEKSQNNKLTVTLGIQRRLDGEKEFVRPRFQSYDELKEFNQYVEYFAQFVK
jgi:hypothetical protein